MPLSASQIVSLSCQMAKCPGYTSQAGQLLNMILSDLCQTYDFQLARTSLPTDFAFNSSYGNGAGPYTLPTNFLRFEKDELTFTINYTPYQMTRIEQDEYDRLSQQPGLASYPYLYVTKRESASSAASLYVWPPASGSYPVYGRYFKQMDDLTTPETSATVPWFENQNYLITRLAGELMKITNDDRAPLFLGVGTDQNPGAEGILQKYLKMKDDPEGRAKTVSLDRRRFGNAWNKLPNTKQVGW